MKSMRIVALLGMFAALLPAGCGWLAPPPDTAVLAGTWSVTAESTPNLNQLLLTFDENGNLDTIQYKVGDNVLVTVPSPLATTDVDGDDVTITAQFNESGLVFNGVLDPAGNVITGNLTTQIKSGDIIITVNNGAATMTRQ